MSASPATQEFSEDTRLTEPTTFNLQEPIFTASMESGDLQNISGTDDLAKGFNGV